jgi:hypothetical protein
MICFENSIPKIQIQTKVVFHKLMVLIVMYGVIEDVEDAGLIGSQFIAAVTIDTYQEHKTTKPN